MNGDANPCKCAALFGAGVQARTQLEAVRNVRSISEVRIVSLERSSSRRFAEELSGIRTVVVDDPAEAVRGADIVITATDSHTPVFDGALVEPGTHVTGIGSFTPEMREVDTTLVRRARPRPGRPCGSLEDLCGPHETRAMAP